MTARMNWGTGIALVYGAFAAATIGFVAFAMRTPADLVSTDYYQRSLRQDEHSAAVRNAQSLGSTVTLTPIAGSRAYLLTLPRAHASDARGTVTLYRASDVRADRALPLAIDEQGVQRVSFDGLAVGRWIAQVSWTSAGLPYYVEQPVVNP